MNYGMNKLLTGFVLFFTVFLSFLIIQYVKIAPLFYVGLLAFLLCLFLSYKFKKFNFWKGFFFNLGILMLLGGLTEGYFTWFKASVIREGEIQTKEDFLHGGDYYVSDAARGYAAGNNIKKIVKKTLKGKVIYDVIYTTNGFGLRVSPHDVDGSGKELNKNYVDAFFFGDSFTYGEGVNDDETLPYLFEKFSGGRYRAYNLAFHGYGPQQMLRVIETGFLEKIVSGQRPRVIVYEALVQHIERAVGKLIWDAKVPRYNLSGSGTPKYAGTFANDPALKKNLEYSKSLANPRSNLLAQTGITRLVGEDRTPEDIRLFVQIVVQTKKLVEKKYNGKFYVVLWPLGDKDANVVINSLENNGVEIITVDQIFKKYQDSPDNYQIPNDNHPTKLANERIAHYLLDYLH